MCQNDTPSALHVTQPPTGRWRAEALLRLSAQDREITLPITEANAKLVATLADG